MSEHGLVQTYDVAVLGSGFAGSLLAMVAKRIGLSVVMLEKGKHPRVVIGESSTPLSNLLLEVLAEEYDLPQLRPLTKWGTWQNTYPQVTCGLKRGFTFYHHELNAVSPHTPGFHDVDRQLLVAASPNNSIADTHWFRAHTDEFLVQQACALGVDYLEECTVQALTRAKQGWTLAARRREQDTTLTARFVVDATGPRGFLHGALGLSEAPLPRYPSTCALYNHFSNVAEYASPAANGAEYPPDAAALHHVFEGGWMWVLRFNNGWTSAGFAVSEALAHRFNFAEGMPAWHRVLGQLPGVQRQFASAKAERPFTYAPRLSFRSGEMAGDNWVLLPSTAGFVDPLLSTGFSLTLLGVLRLGEALSTDWGSSRFSASLQHYAEKTDGELLATARLIAALYANMGDFAFVRSLLLLYFAAASFAETVRRLGKTQGTPTFLLHDDRSFGPECRRILERALMPLSADEKLLIQDQIYRLIEPFDLAGLGHRPADHCYPVRAADLYAGAHKVNATHEEIEALLHRSGFLSAT